MCIRDSPFYVDCVEAVPCEFDDSLLATDDACVEPAVEEPVAMCEIDGLGTLTADDENCEEAEEVVITDGGDSEEEAPETEEEAPETEEEAPETEEEVEEIAITDEVPETEEELPVTGGMHRYMVAISLALLVAGSLLLASSKIKAAHKVIA